MESREKGVYACKVWKNVKQQPITRELLRTVEKKNKYTYEALQCVTKQEHTYFIKYLTEW
jgi:hypothetical protein